MAAESQCPGDVVQQVEAENERPCMTLKHTDCEVVSCLTVTQPVDGSEAGVQPGCTTEDCLLMNDVENVNPKTELLSSSSADGDMQMGVRYCAVDDGEKSDDVTASCYSEAFASAAVRDVVASPVEADKTCTQSLYDNESNHTASSSGADSKTIDVMEQVDDAVTSQQMYSDADGTPVTSCTADQLYKLGDSAACLGDVEVIRRQDNVVSVDETETDNREGLHDKTSQSPGKITTGIFSLEEPGSFHADAAADVVSMETATHSDEPTCNDGESDEVLRICPVNEDSCLDKSFETTKNSVLTTVGASDHEVCETSELQGGRKSENMGQTDPGGDEEKHSSKNNSQLRHDDDGHERLSANKASTDFEDLSSEVDDEQELNRMTHDDAECQEHQNEEHCIPHKDISEDSKTMHLTNNNTFGCRERIAYSEIKAQVEEICKKSFAPVPDNNGNESSKLSSVKVFNTSCAENTTTCKPAIDWHLHVSEDFQQMPCTLYMLDDFTISQRTTNEPYTRGSQLLPSHSSMNSEVSFIASQTVTELLATEPESNGSTEDRNSDDIATTPASSQRVDIIHDENACFEAVTCPGLPDKRRDILDSSTDVLCCADDVEPAGQMEEEMDHQHPNGMDVLASVCESLVNVTAEAGNGAVDVDGGNGSDGKSVEMVEENCHREYCWPNTAVAATERHEASDNRKMGCQDDVSTDESCVTLSGLFEERECHDRSCEDVAQTSADYLHTDVDDDERRNSGSLHSSAAAVPDGDDDDDGGDEYETRYDLSSDPYEFNVDSESDASRSSNYSCRDSDELTDMYTDESQDSDFEGIKLGISEDRSSERDDCDSQTAQQYADADSCEDVAQTSADCLDNDADDDERRNNGLLHSSAAAAAAAVPDGDNDEDDGDEYETSYDLSSDPYEFSIDSESDASRFSNYSCHDSDELTDMYTDESQDSDFEGSQFSDDVMIFDDVQEFDRVTQPDVERQDDQTGERCIPHKDTSEDTEDDHLTGNDTLGCREGITCTEVNGSMQESFATVPDNDGNECSGPSKECVPRTAEQSETCTFGRKCIKLGISEDCSSEVWWHGGVPEDHALVDNKYEFQVLCDDDDNYNDDDNDDDGGGDGGGGFQVAVADCGGDVLNANLDKTVHTKTSSSDVDISWEKASGVDNCAAPDDVADSSSSTIETAQATVGLDEQKAQNDLFPLHQVGQREVFGVEDDDYCDVSRTSEDEIFYTDCEEQQEGKQVERGITVTVTPATAEADLSRKSLSSCDVHEQSQHKTFYTDCVEQPAAEPRTAGAAAAVVPTADLDSSVGYFSDVSLIKTEAKTAASHTLVSDDDDVGNNAADAADVHVASPVAMNNDKLTNNDDVLITHSSSTSGDVTRRGVIGTDSSTNDGVFVVPVISTAYDRDARNDDISASMDQSTRYSPATQQTKLTTAYHETPSPDDGASSSSTGRPQRGEMYTEGPGYDRASRDQQVLDDSVSKPDNLVLALPGYHGNYPVDKPALTSVASSNVDRSVANSNANLLDYCNSVQSDDDAERRDESMMMTSCDDQLVDESVDNISSDELLYAAEPDSHSHSPPRTSHYTDRYSELLVLLLLLLCVFLCVFCLLTVLYYAEKAVTAVNMKL